MTVYKKYVWALLMLVVLLLWPTFVWAADQKTIAPGDVEALVLLDAMTEGAMQEILMSLEGGGARVLASFPNQGVFVSVPSEQIPALRQMSGVREVILSSADTNLAGEDVGAYHAIVAWNARLSPLLSNPSASTPAFPDNAVIIPEDFEQQQAARRGNASASPGVYQTSEYMHNRVQVDVFLVESNGRVDGNSESWTLGTRDHVIAGVTNGLVWWAITATQGGRPSAQLAFNIVFHTPFNEPNTVATDYEPIGRPHTDQNLWMEQVMGHLGYTERYYSAIREYVHDRRTATGRDWAFTVWVVNSVNDGDGKFSDNWFGYASLFGPYTVMTYDNDGWGIDDMEIVMAHETAHIFGALDEYASSGCADSDQGGYLDIANTNCENGDPATETSIMRSSANQRLAYAGHLISTPVRYMVGLRDSDGDGLYDPVDTQPVTMLDTYAPDPSEDATPTWTGQAEDIAYPAPRRTDVSINHIAQVAYQMDGGSWHTCVADDGAFDETEEAFSCTPGVLSDGTHTIQVQSRNRVNHNATLVDDTVLVDTHAPSNPTMVSAGCEAQDDVWQRMCVDPAFTWSGADDYGGTGVKDYHIYWGTESEGVPTTWQTSVNYDPPAIVTDTGVAVYYLRLATRDNLDHESDPETVFTLRYDSTSPTLNPIIAGGVETVHTLDVSVEPHAQDTGSGAALLRLSNDAEIWQTSTYSANVLWTLAPIGRGWQTVYLDVDDGAGNRSAQHACRVCVDLYPPHPSSTGYRLWSAGAAAAGGRLTAATYLLDQSVGQPMAGAVLSSTNYQVQSGFLGSVSARLDNDLFTPYQCVQEIYLPVVWRR